MKILFLDESGDHSLTKIDTQFPVFSLAGCIFDEHKYQENCKSKIDALKIKHFNTTDVILHSREIRKCDPPFNILLNKNTKKIFYEDLNNLMSELPYTIIASAILKQKFKDKYTDPANPYAISLEFVMERFLFFLEENNDVGYICAESRDSKSNTDLLGSFTNIINEGIYENTHMISATRFQKKIQKMTFITKQQNENGHQIADLVAYPIAKYALDPKKENLALNVIKSKFRRKGNKVIGYGLKIFP
jgi:hypothetical protein